MKKPKYYFEKIDDEMCYTLDYHLDNAKSNGLSEIKLYEAIPDKDPEFFFCKAVGECGMKGDCGKQCQEYEPRNKRFGICKHKGICYLPNELVNFNI